MIGAAALKIRDCAVDIISVIVFLAMRTMAAVPGARKKGLRVLLYHSIDPEKGLGEINVDPKIFAEHLKYITRGRYDVIGPEELHEDYLGDHAGAKTPVAITFDDGFGNVYINAYPMLKKAGLRAALFITCGWLDDPSRSVYGKGGRSLYPLGWEDLNRMKDVFMFGAHGVSHSDLTQLDGAALKSEAEESKRIIEDRTGSKVDYFAYPFGFYDHFDDRTERALKDAGYKMAFINVMGDNSDRKNVFRVRRTRIGPRDTAWRFRLKLAGGYDWIDAVKRRCTGN